jgi:RNA polymerase sigma-70 factor (ECF subfamily)
MPDRTNLEWWEALQGEPDEAALADLRATMLRGLRHALGSRPGVTEDDLEDFVQEALLKILREMGSFRGESRFTTWCQKVCVRVALTELRRRRWRDVSLQDVLEQFESSGFTPALLADPAPDPGQQAVRRAMLAKIEQLIAEELTPKQRQAMLAVMQGGMPLQEAAERMGMSRNALYKLLHDARRRLQKRMMREGLTPDDLLAMFDEG